MILVNERWGRSPATTVVLDGSVASKGGEGANLWLNLWLTVIDSDIFGALLSDGNFAKSVHPTRIEEWAK
jgi:hypothetical protein